MSSLQSTPGVTPYPQEAVDRYITAGLWGERRIEELLDDAAARTPQAPAVSDATGTWSHAELAARTRDAATALAAWGIEPGATLVLQLPNSKQAIACFLGCLHLGARPVLALPAHRATEVAGFVRGSDATHWVVGELPGVDVEEMVRTTMYRLGRPITVVRWQDTAGADLRLLPQRCAGADELAFFQLSGGTTGASKLIPRSHREYAYSFLRSNELCGVDASTVLVIPLPLTHNFPMSSPGFLGVLAAGGHVVLTAAGDPASICSAIEEHRGTHLVAVPPLAHLLLDSGARAEANLSSLRRVIVGGARLAPAIARRLHTEIAPLQQVYGMAEGLVCYTDLDDDDETVTTTQGRPMSSHDEIRVVAVGDDTCTPLDHGEVGELQVRGPYTIRGYYRPGPRENASFTADGFYRTGDLVRVRADGAITVVGRTKEQINRGGEKISPAEVENALLRHPGVHDCCVVGEKDGLLGERLVAYVVARTDHDGLLDRRVLRRHLVEQSLAAYKIPDAYHVVDTLPTTAAGKISRNDFTGAAPDSVDVLGIGFGPANMALAVALREHERAGGTPLTARFVDAAAGPRWHEGLLFESSSMQVAFAKDLVTMRNPRSEFGFLQFLAEKGRLADFLNRGSMTPLRIEFVEYLRWASSKLADVVTYGASAQSITPVVVDDVIEGYDVTIATSTGFTRTRARHVVLAAGLQARMPAELPPAARVWHSGRHLQRVPDLDPASVREAVVIGGGQSAAEVLLDLRQRYPEARLHSVHSRFGLTPSDATPYANQIFDAASVDLLFDAPPSERARLDALHASTNDAVVSASTLQALYDADYRDHWLGREGVVWHRSSRVAGAREQDGRVVVTIHESLTGTDVEVTADAVVCATGYEPLDPALLLGDQAGLMERDEHGRPVARRDHTARWRVEDRGHLVLVGQTRHQHGVSTVLLSNIAVRAGEIVATLTGTAPRCLARTGAAQPVGHAR